MKLNAFIAGGLMMATAPAAAQTAPTADPAPSAAVASQHYTTAETDIGTLMDDPAAMAVLVKHFPEMFKSDQIEQARSMTLKEIQPYSSDVLSDAALASVDAELGKLPMKK
jgi:hypothetical protein